ncbi:glycosyltransferase 87 family protein [Catellatospora sichuanensis]|uniref:glycosyltransferase 87 family protein n=1 Tax=Catellatospora sichuanensis TaxID=1969805 RepID=UPI001642B57F|nr:glycosyltransferase 87 family protein [Catellatospora sichuanensis]
MVKTSRARLLCVLLLATAVGLFIALIPGHRGWFDVLVYYGTVDDWVHEGGVIYDYLVPGTHYGFTYPPFAAVAMLPMSLLGWHTVIAVNVALTAVACAFLLYWLVDPIAREQRWPRLFAFGIAACLLAALQPARDTVSFGQVNLLLVALVLADARLLTSGRSRWAGVGIGIAAAIKLTPAIFIGYLLLAGRRRAAVIATGTAAAATLLAALIAPGPSWRFWTETLGDTSRVGDLFYISNQSLRGVIARLDPDSPHPVFWLLTVVGVLALWAWRVRRAARAGDVWGGFALTGLAACLVSPVTWVHHLVWVVPALVLVIGAGLREPDPARRRRLLWSAGAAYVILCSSVVWLWWYDFSGPGGFLGGSAYVWITLGLLVLLPLRSPTPTVHRAAAQESITVRAVRS